MSVVVNTEANGNYAPSEDEIIQYGSWLGMKLPEDNPFLWIAREGLKAPLPENWRACQSDKGELYYFNFKTGQSIWDHPMDNHFKDLFKREKQNPTPRSIAVGAKRREEPAPAARKEEKSTRKKHGADKSNKSGVSPPLAREDEALQARSDADTKATSINIQPLKSLKVKKELPKEMRIEFDKGAPEKKSNQPHPAPLVATELRVATTQSESSEELSPRAKPRVSPDDVGAIKTESPASAAARGVKSLRMLSENNRNSPPTTSAATEALNAAAVAAEERERIVKTTKEEVEKFKTQMSEELQQQREQLRAKTAEATKALWDSCEEEKEAKLKDIRKELDRSLSERRRTLESEMQASLESARKEIEAQKTADIARLKENYAAQLEEEKRRLSEELTEKLEEFGRAQRSEAEEKKYIFLQSARGLEKSVANALQHSCNEIVRGFEDSYAAFSRAVASSHTDFALRSIQQKEETQRQLDSQLSSMQEEHHRAISAEKESHERELSEMRAAFATEKEQVAASCERELKEIRSQLAGRVQDEKESVEKAALIKELSLLRASHEEELESLRKELRQRADEEVKAAVAELTEEMKLREAASAASQGSDAVPHKQEVQSGPQHRQGGNEDVVKAPRLDDNLLHNEASPSELYAVLRHSQTKDIKTAVTEALCEMFAESPFTIPSPARGSASASPHRQEPAAARRPSLPVPVPATTDGIADSPATRGYRATGPSVPTSFQEQRTLVEDERQRVNEGRRFVEAQRKNLEERRQQLRRTRHQWKQDVMAAKEEGVRSSSKRGQLLNKVRLALEGQAKGLEHDEAILHESMAWLQSKEQRLMQLDQQIEELERARAAGDNSTMNCSVDTAALVTGYFKPQRVSLPEPLGRRMSQSLGGVSGSMFSPFESPAATPVFSSALSRIERRLDEVTSLINLQKSQSLSTSPSNNQQSGLRRTSLATPSASQSQNRHRTSRSHSKVADGVRETHADPW